MKISSIVFLFLFSSVCSDLIIQERKLSILVGSSGFFSLDLTKPLTEPVNVSVEVLEKGVLTVDPAGVDVPANTTGHWRITVSGLERGHILVTASVNPNITKDDDAYIRVTVEYSEILTFISTVIGWIYFCSWTISFYPQIYENFIRKSVVGLNFDFLALNVVGFSLYSVFNCSLYWIHVVEEEYFRRHPRGLNPVQLNDIFFAVHATFATLFTIGQCVFYERGEQRVSKMVWAILGVFTLSLIVCFSLVILNYIGWLDFLYGCSYIKLIITLIKYIPQAFMNHQRKSTVGWSIGNVLLDIIGGSLSIGQMLINSYNYNDWISIFGDPTKFGLGLFSVVFDILFIIQHYILYRNPQRKDNNFTSTA